VGIELRNFYPSEFCQAAALPIELPYLSLTNLYLIKYVNSTDEGKGVGIKIHVSF
jgi:hypothetical protein